MRKKPIHPNTLANLQHSKPLGDKALSSRPLCVKMPQEIDDYVRSNSSPSSWLREAIEVKYYAEVQSQVTTEVHPQVNAEVDSKVDIEQLQGIKNKILTEWELVKKPETKKRIGLALDKMIEALSQIITI
jgi:hypothetical protein